jgi:DNA-binding NtrC family response regulator
VPEKLSVPDDGRQGVVLLVEDDPDVAAYTGLVLRRLAGARVLDAPSTDAALAVLAAEDVDVVVTDIDLVPGADGLELTALVRKRRPLLPVIVLSGHATFDHAVVAMRAGAAEFLAKPVDLHLLRVVELRLDPAAELGEHLPVRRRERARPGVVEAERADGVPGRRDERVACVEADVGLPGDPVGCPRRRSGRAARWWRCRTRAPAEPARSRRTPART